MRALPVFFTSFFTDTSSKKQLFIYYCHLKKSETENKYIFIQYVFLWNDCAYIHSHSISHFFFFFIKWKELVVGWTRTWNWIWKEKKFFSWWRRRRKNVSTLCAIVGYKKSKSSKQNTGSLFKKLVYMYFYGVC